MRIRQSLRPYEIVGDCSDKSCHWYQPLDRFVLQVVLARRCVMPSLCYLWWCMLFLINPLELNLLCDLYFTRFVLTKGLIFYILFHCVLTIFFVVITRYLNPNHFQYQWIGIPNKTLKSNASQTIVSWKKMCPMWDFMWKECAFFVERNRRRQNLFRQMSRRENFFDCILIGTLSCSSWYWLMIAFITCNSNLVFLLEGLCCSNPCRFEFSGFLWVFAGNEPTTSRWTVPCSDQLS